MPKDRSSLPWSTIRHLNLDSLDDVCVPLLEAKRLLSLPMLLVQVTIPMSSTHDPTETCLLEWVSGRVYTKTTFSTRPFTYTLQTDPISRHIAFVTVHRNCQTNRQTIRNSKPLHFWIKRKAKTCLESRYSSPTARTVHPLLSVHLLLQHAAAHRRWSSGG